LDNRYIGSGLEHAMRFLAASHGNMLPALAFSLMQSDPVLAFTAFGLWRLSPVICNTGLGWNGLFF
jgi:hypothetical protein